jgi:hypothetical protein
MVVIYDWTVLTLETRLLAAARRKSNNAWSSSQMDRLMSSAAPWRRLRRLPLDHCFATHVGLRCHRLDDLELDGCTFEFGSIFFDSLKTLFLKHSWLGNLSEIAASPRWRPWLFTAVWIFRKGNILKILQPLHRPMHMAVPYYRHQNWGPQKH